ncbi:MAG TPA: hypothetical protein VIO11_09540 [Candidatus Methanoperedens sp.]
MVLMVPQTGIDIIKSNMMSAGIDMILNLICKHCRDAIMKAGGLPFHTKNGFSHICKICRYRFPEKDEHNPGENI